MDTWNNIPDKTQAKREASGFEIVFRVIWTLLILSSIGLIGWLTFVSFRIGNGYVDVWDFLISNLITILILVIYSKELLFGYAPRTIEGNKVSLIIFTGIMLVLMSSQMPFFKSYINNEGIKTWQPSLVVIMVLSSYVGIIANRILLLFKKFDHKDEVTNQVE